MVLDFHTRLGARVKELREKSELTQEDLAGMLGLNRTSVVDIEKGKRKVCAEEVVKLSEIFRIPINALLDSSKETVVILEKVARKPDKPQIRINVPQRNVAKFKEVLLYILNKVGLKPNVGETVIYKLLYFIDFDFYEIYEKQLIGATYMKNKYGPTPAEFDSVVSEMVKHGEIKRTKIDYHNYPQKRYLPLREPDLSILGAHEVNLIDKVLSRLADKNATEISEHSHGDIPWIAADDGEKIEYESVFYRTPQYSVRRYDEEIQ